VLWGYANGWYPEFLARDDDELYAKLKFLLAHGLQETGVPLEDVAALPEGERARLGEFLEENDLHLTPYVGYDYVNAGEDEARSATEEICEGLQRYGPMLRAWCVFTNARAGHRFDRSVPVEEKIERLCTRLRPLAAACHQMGMPLGINNQGDFYCHEFAEMCERTPHLFVHLDTANIYWAGERFWPAFETVAPHVIATHWRDERVLIGQRKPRGVALKNCAMGEGDVPLRRAYTHLLEVAPRPDRLVMEIEMFSPPEMTHAECLEKTLAFVRSLEEETT
jgi:sugar phosphate isomerase/epimerase